MDKTKFFWKIQACAGMQPVTSAILVQWSTNWDNKPTASWSFCGFMKNPWRINRWVWIYKIKYLNRGLKHENVNEPGSYEHYLSRSENIESEKNSDMWRSQNHDWVYLNHKSWKNHHFCLQQKIIMQDNCWVCTNVESATVIIFGQCHNVLDNSTCQLQARCRRTYRSEVEEVSV